MEGLPFVRGDHLAIAGGCFLPAADLLGYVQARLHVVASEQPSLKAYLPHLIDVDIFVTWDGDRFILFVSPERRAHIPTRGMEMTHLPAQREAGLDVLQNLRGFEDISDTAMVAGAFKQIGFAPGIAIAGTFPLETYTDEAKAAKVMAANEVARLFQAWAERKRDEVENSRIFLSHRGINKPLVEKVDAALRQLNLKTWFDRDDLVAGDTLVRGVDDAFASCGAAVFFISGEYVDAGVIRNEIDRARHEAAMREHKFRIIPLVLAQHGGTDAQVPATLTTLVWKTVEDVGIVPAILRGLPDFMQAQIRYAPPK